MQKPEGNPFFHAQTPSAETAEPPRILMPPNKGKIILPGSEPIPVSLLRGNTGIGYGARTQQLVAIGRHTPAQPPPIPAEAMPEVIDLTDEMAPVTQVPQPPIEAAPVETPMIETPVEAAPVETAPVETPTVEPEAVTPTHTRVIYLSDPAPRNEGGATENGFRMFDENTDNTERLPVFGALPDTAYVALVGTWAVNDAEMIKVGLESRQIEAYVPNPDNWRPERMVGYDKNTYVQELVDYEHDGLFQADAVLLDLRGPLHHQNDYLVGALAGSTRQLYVVMDDHHDNMLLRAKLDYYQRNGSKIEICANIFDAVLQIADYMDTFQWQEEFTSREVTKENIITREVYTAEAEDNAPKLFTIGVGVLIRNEQGQFLGFRKREGGTVNLPFGFLKKSELPAEGAARILASEAGVIVSADDLVQIHVGWRGRRSGYVACFGVKSDAIIRRTTADAPYVLESAWVEQDVLASNESYGDYNTQAIDAYEKAPVVLATVMDLSGDLMNVSPTVAMRKQEQAAAPVAEA